MSARAPSQAGGQQERNMQQRPGVSHSLVDDQGDADAHKGEGVHKVGGAVQRVTPG